MQKLLFKRTLRDLKSNFFRYMALFLLIILCMFIVVGTIGSAVSVIESVNKRAEANHLEDGQFGVFVPLDKKTLQELKHMRVTLEECFYLDFLMEDASTLRVMKNRESLNLVYLEEGAPAYFPGEIIVERIYAAAHDLSIGDNIKIAGTDYTISGIGTSPDYEYCLQNMSGMSSDGNVFGTAFVTPEAYNELLAGGKALHAEEYRYSYLLGDNMTHSELKDYLKNIQINPDEVKDPFFQEMVNRKTKDRDTLTDSLQELLQNAGALSGNPEAFQQGAKELQAKAGNLMDSICPLEIENLTDFVKAEDNPRIKAANRDVEINIKVGLTAGIIVLILITYVISVFIIHSIDQESPVIGALYALGLKRKQLLRHYTMLPVLLCLLGGAAGTALGYSQLGMSMMTAESYTYYSTPPIETCLSRWLLIYGFLLPPFTAFLVTRFLIQKRLKRSALSLLRKEISDEKENGIRIRHLSFLSTFQIRQFLREKRSCLAILAGMFVSLLILMLGLNCYSLCLNIKQQNTADTRFSYMYQYKYPAEAVPEGGYPAYIKGLKKEVFGFPMEVSIIGLTDDNPFFPDFSPNRKDEICISSSVAAKYRLSAGDEFILKDEVNERLYGFTITEIVPYSTGLCCFMDIDSMRALFNQDDGYYNAVYSDSPLDIDPGRLYAVSTKADIEKSSDIFMEIMKPLMIMLISVSIFVFLIVLYQMTKVMIDRSSYNISLMKIFGYRNKEIRKLYLDGSAYLIAFGSLLMLPAGKILIDLIYPAFIFNIACGGDLSWSPILYSVVYIGILLCYFLIRTLLLSKLKELTPAQILRAKE